MRVRKVREWRVLREAGRASGRQRRSSRRRDWASKRGWRSSKLISCCVALAKSGKSGRFSLRGWFFLFVSLLIITILLFECVDVLAEAVETLFDGGFGGGESFGDVADGEVVEAEVEECAVVGFEEREQMVVVGRSEGLLFGDGVVHPILEWYEAGLLDMVADLGDGDIEGDAAYPCVGVAVAPEVGPRFPEVAGDFLVEVADVFGVVVGEVEADLEDGALGA